MWEKKIIIMDSTLLSASLDYISGTGICIATEKLLLLNNSLTVLQKENHFKKVFYWGKINGYENDYHIAYGYIKDCLVGQLYYYSLNCLDWLLLPKVTRTDRILTPLVLDLFYGNPAITTAVDVPHELLENLENNNTIQDIAEDSISKIMNEEILLSATIEMITETAMIVPRGSWFKHPNGDFTENVAFTGLNFNESIQLKSYLHARLPQKKWNENLLTRHDYNYSMDFLDPIDVDTPKECWNLQLQSRNNSVVLQNLYWPGMTFYHIINSPHYGFVYVGNGKQNLDVPFII